MSNKILNPNNSGAVNEPLINCAAYSSRFFPVENQHEFELQSSSVTPIGCLWQQALARMTKEDLPLVSEHKLSRIEPDSNIEQMQRNYALIQLLRSWREGDEQEQRDTWEYLKKALDEDRLSDRKLFP